MSHQVIRQPDGLFAVFSSVTETWIVYDADRSEIIDWFAEQAEREARERAERVMNAVEAGEPSKIYYQFAMSFEKANTQSAERGGLAWADGWPQPA
jgi:hypothetical protein